MYDVEDLVLADEVALEAVLSGFLAAYGAEVARVEAEAGLLEDLADSALLLGLAGLLSRRLA